MHERNVWRIEEEQAKFQFSHYPAFKFLLLLLLLLVCFFQLEINIYTLIIPIALAIIALLFKLNRGIIYLLFCAEIALLLIFNINKGAQQYPSSVFQDMPAMFSGRIEKIIKRDTNYTAIFAKGNAKSAELPRDINCRIYLSITNSREKNTKQIKDSLQLRVGDIISANIRIEPPPMKVLPNDFDWQAYALFNQIDWYGRAFSDNIAIINREKNLYYYAQSLSEGIAQAIGRLFNNETAPIVKALILGDKSSIGKETKANFALTGTAHVLAVSGLHVGIISSIILLLIGGINNRKLKFLVFSILIIAYIILTGFSPSVLRAGFMAIFLYFVYALERYSNTLNIFSFALLVIIIISPSELLSPSFQMSAAAVLGIVLLFPIFNSNLQSLFGFPKSIISIYIIKSISMSLAASTLITPIIAYYFGTYSLISPFANVIVIPLISFSMYFAIISLLFSMVHFPFALFYAESVNLIIQIALYINKVAAGLPFAYIKDNNIVIISIIISLSILYLLLANRRRKLLFRGSVVAVSLFCVGIIFNSNREDFAVKLLPRKHISVAEVPLSANATFIYLADRDNHRAAFPDKKLVEYLSAKESKLTVGITGFAGFATAKAVNKSKAIRIVELSHSAQDSIEKLLKLRMKLVKVVNKN